MKRGKAAYGQAVLLAVTTLVILVNSMLGECRAQTMPLVPIVQARYFKKVFTYNKSLPKDGVKILVAFSDAPSDLKDEIIEAFTAVGMQAVLVKTSQLATVKFDGHVVFALGAADVQAVREYCKAKSLLSTTAFPSFVKNGDISISIESVNDQARVVVNPERLKTERQDAPDLMRLR
jgi:hypothetical protein